MRAAPQSAMCSTHAKAERDPFLPRRTLSQSVVTPELRGYAYMLLGALCWALLTFFVHTGVTNFNFPTNASIIIRSAVNLCLSFAYILLRRDLSILPTRSQLLPLAARSFAGTIGCFSIFMALKHIAVGSATTIFCTSPVISTVLSAIFLHEPVTNVDRFALLSSLVGVVFVAQPPFLFHDHKPPIIPNANHSFGIVCACIAACCASTVYTLVRSMGLRVNFILNVVALGIGMSILSLFLAEASDLQHILNNREGLLVNVLGALSGFGCVACFSRGLQFCRAGPAMVIRTTDIPISFVLGYLFLGETLSAFTALGVAPVMAAAIAVGLREAVADSDSNDELPRSCEQQP